MLSRFTGQAGAGVGRNVLTPTLRQRLGLATGGNDANHGARSGAAAVRMLTSTRCRMLMFDLWVVINFVF